MRYYFEIKKVEADHSYVIKEKKIYIITFCTSFLSMATLENRRLRWGIFGPHIS